MLRGLVLAVGLCAALVACGGDDGGTDRADTEDDGSSSTDDTGTEGTEGGDGGGGDKSLEDCVDLAIMALSKFDISDIEASDGISQAESDDLDAQFEDIAEEHPEIDEGGECDQLLSSDPSSRDDVLEGLDEDLVTVLTAPFNEPETDATTGSGDSGSSIN